MASLFSRCVPWLGLGSSSDPSSPTDDDARTTNTAAWSKLELALRGLQGSLDVFPPLKLAVGGLLECMVHIQMAEQNRQEYALLALDLAQLASHLQTHLPQSQPKHMPYSVENVARAIQEQVRHIQGQQSRSRESALVAAREYHEDVLKCYRRIQVLFQQLQTDISLSIWDALREQQMDMYMKGLSPADDAYYNSALPTAMTKRRGCTLNTRTKVLADAHIWTRVEAAKIYWMNGMAGTGKTTIACSLCKLLEDNMQLGASFFCSRDSPNCRDVNKIVPTIAYQLGEYSNPYRQALCEVLKRKPDIAKKDLDTQFESLIARPLSNAKIKQAMPGDVVVVIDALDECVDVAGTKQVLDLLFRHAPELPIKFFVASRPEPSISNRVLASNEASRSILRLHDIEQSLVEEDIKTYLTEALASSPLTPDEVHRLAVRAGRLFIFAATAVRYILPDTGSVNPRRRLATVLGLDQNPSNKSHRDIDNLYSKILLSALDKETLENSEFALRQQVLGTVVCASEPLTMSTIAELLGLTDDHDVRLAIEPLQSVLHVSQTTEVVSTFHASFPDFLLSSERAGTLYCDRANQNLYLATRCFEEMKRSLRFNICGLETSYRLDKDVPNLPSRVNEAIPLILCYACRYWGDHLLESAPPTTLLPMMQEFLQHRLLFWMEVLNLKGWMGHGENILNQALNWFPSDDDLAELRQLMYDARNFVTIFAGNPASLSTPHIYISVLPFTPKQSYVWMNYWPRTRGLLRVEGTAIEARGNVALATWAVESGVNSIAQSSDGRWIVSGSDGGTVSIWDVFKGTRIVGPLRGHKRRVWSVAFSPDGTRVASGSADNTIRVWDARNGGLVSHSLNNHTEPIHSIAFSPDGARLASGSKDCTIRVWDAHNCTPIGNAFKGHRGCVESVAFSQDGMRIASGSQDCTIRVFDSHTGATIVGPIKGHTAHVYSVAFSPDGSRIVSGSGDSTVRVWGAQNGKSLACMLEGHAGGVVSVAFSHDGMRVVSGSSDHIVKVWDAQSGVLLTGPFDGHRSSVNSVLFSADGTRVFSGSDDCKICVWDARRETAAATKTSGHTGKVYSVTMSPDGTHAASGSGDQRIRVWNMGEGTLVNGSFEGHTGEVKAVAFSPDSACLVSGSDDRTLRTWNVHNGTLLAGPFIGHTGSVWSVTFSPDGSCIVSGSKDGTIRVWDPHSGAPMADPFKGHTKPIKSVAFSPKGAHIASGSADRSIRMWNVHNNAAPEWISEICTGEVTCLAFSSDGVRLVSRADNGVVMVLNAHDGMVLQGPFQPDGMVIGSVMFAPIGTRVISGSGERTISMWDAQESTLVAGPFEGHTSNVRSLTFSPDGRSIISGSDDGTIRVWEVATPVDLPATNFDQSVLDEDGWLTCSNSNLLLWVPHDVRPALPRPANRFVICATGVMHVDYSSLLLGEHWRECYSGPSVNSLS